MNNYFRILYVHTRSMNPVEDYPEDVKWIRDWSWRRSPVVRWSRAVVDELPDAAREVDIVVLDWSSTNSIEAAAACAMIRKSRPDLPILIVELYQGQTPTRDALVATDGKIHVVRELTDEAQIGDGFAALRIALPPPSLKIHPDPNDLTTIRLMEWAGPERLPLMIQKYFPRAMDAYILPVGGGWSDAKLCRLFVDTDESEYFLKFFTSRDVYTAELSRHAEAKKWLGSSTVDLKLVPDIEGDVEAQNEAFQDDAPARYPVCYESASTRERARETYKELYLDHPADFLEGVLDRLLAILATNQPDAEVFAPPWTDSGGNGFHLSSDIKVNVLDTMHDLAMYGPPASDRWRDGSKAIHDLMFLPLPTWLYEPSPVKIGHIHGDPNPRNCLVNPKDKDDVQLIDCGGYQPDGRLVADLALIERDVKLVLMGTEKSAGGFFDLEVGSLPDWCHAESDSISRKLNYTPDFAPDSPDPIRRAYRLIGRVRERAKQVSGRDELGRHYFAALLFWTLDIVKYKAVRPTKKLLAIHSSAEIIRAFSK
jgi:hypothetical protein